MEIIRNILTSTQKKGKVKKHLMEELCILMRILSFLTEKLTYCILRS